MCDLGFIVEGHCEFDSFPSIVSKIQGFPAYYPIVNAAGIGNIMKNTAEQLLALIKLHEPRKIIISLDYRDAFREGLVGNCIELKEKVLANCRAFIEQQEQNGTLNLPDSIVVVIADRTYETWICADYISLRDNPLFDVSKINEEYNNVDIEILNPGNWLKERLVNNVDLKSRAHRKAIYKTWDPNVAKDKSRSFAKFYKEVNIY